MAGEIDEVKKRLDVVDFIGTFVTLKKAGRNFKALCPFHTEKTPSFVVSPDRQTWHCFGGCQEGGDVIKFLMKWENITFFEALKELAAKTGVPLKKLDIEDQLWKKKERLFAMNALAEEFYHFILKKHQLGKAALQYLEKRNISAKIIDTFKLGYAPNSWDSLLQFLKKRGYDNNEIVTVGLAIQKENGRSYDRFRGRLIFPLKDPRSNTIGFSGRIMDGNKEAKYINSPETAIYHKRETLFGINITRDAIRKKDQVILVEGEFDLLSLFKEGITNIVAIKGSAVTKEQLLLLKRYAKRIIFSLDTDSSGVETTIKAIQEAENLDFEVFVADFDFAKDPDEAIKKDPVAFKKSIEHPIAVYDYIINQSVKKFPEGDAFSKKNIGAEVIPFIAVIQNPIVQFHYINKLATVLSVDTKSIEALIRKEQLKARRKKNPIKKVETENIVSRLDLLQKYVLSLLFQSAMPEKTWEQIFSILELPDFPIVSYQKLVEYFLVFKNDDKNDLSGDWIKQFTERLPDELVPVFDEIYLFDAAIFDKNIEEVELTRILYELKKLSLKKKISETMKNANHNVESNVIAQLVNNLSQVEKKLVIL